MCGSTTRWSPNPSTRPGPSRSRPGMPAIEDTFIVVERRRPHRPRHDRTRRLPPLPRSSGHHPPQGGGRPVEVRRRSHRRRRPCHRVRREAPGRPGAHQSDQRRHLRPRARGAGAHPCRPPCLGRARDLPRARRRGAVFAMASDAYWLDTGTPEAYLQANIDLLEGVRPGLPAPDARQVSLGVWTLGAAHRAGRGAPAPACSASARRSPARPPSRASVIGARSVVEHGACVERLGAAARGTGGQPAPG